ncbi:MAG: glycosyltransferase [Candidatus Pacebacteria bacterium]|nr:glycosyltransferase [Candidatus Paceibacterota bacterium]MCF7856934.1 glycosyltransferase [Candidatus Paceibacterota bacterium]
MEILTVGIARKILDVKSREYRRMRTYAKHFEAFHAIVLTRKEHGYGDVLHDETLNIYPTNSSSRMMMLWDAYRIGKEIARQKRKSTLIISAQDPLEIGWLCFLLSSIKNTCLHVQIHGDYFSSNAWAGKSLLRYARRFFALVLLKRAVAIRVVSERIKKSLCSRGISSGRIAVLPIRPELESFCRVVYTVKKNPPYTFLYIGRLVSEKNITRIVKAFSNIHTKYPDTRLTIVGDGEEKKKIESLIQKLKIGSSVDIRAWTENVPNEMADADVLLLASKHEAYALTLVEAMATGLPLVTTDVGCVGELVKDDEHGIVVTEEGVDAYSKAMERMVSDYEFRKACSENGKKTMCCKATNSNDEYIREWVSSVSMALQHV